MNIRKISETASKMTLAWDPVPGAAAGYRGRDVTVSKWTQTQKTEMVFAKGASVVIQALGVEDEGTWPQATPPPPTGLPPRSTNVVRRFTRAHSSQFTAGRNRYVPPAGSNTSWWQPPEKTGTPWRGSVVGSEDITTPHGEGLRFNALDEMVFLGVSQNRMCALEIQGSFPEYEGMAQQWDGYIRLPSTGNVGGVPGGHYEGHNILQIGATTGGGPDTNGHKLFLGNDRRLVFAIRHDDSQWADRLFFSSPISYDDWHHIRWEILVTEAASGYHRAWVNGTQVFTQTGPTIWSGETIWEMMLGWYSPRSGVDNQIEFSEWQLARL